VTKAFKFFDTIILADVFVMVTDGLGSEVPLGCDDLFLRWVDPEFVSSVRISVESRH